MPDLSISYGACRTLSSFSISERATKESSAASTMAPGLSLSLAPTFSGVISWASVGDTNCRMASTSSTWARRELSVSPSRRAMLVTSLPPVPLASADSTCFQSRRTMSSTDSTANAWVVRAYSVTSMMFRPVWGLQPMMAGRFSTGITCPRRFATPSEWAVPPAMGVMCGMATISRTLNTLIPNSSDWPRPESLPSRNSSSSNLLLLVRLVRSSISL